MEIEFDAVSRNYRMEINGGLRILVDYDEDATRTEAECLATTIKELLGVLPYIKLHFRTTGENWYGNGDKEIQAAIDRIREAEKKAGDMKKISIRIVGACATYADMTMTPEQIDANIAALQKAKGE